MGDVIVAVGANGIFQFTPNTVTASNGTTLRFQFVGTASNHSVTHSSFSAPCTPLFDGVDSGFVPVTPDASGIPEWSFTIIDDRRPEWFFCRQNVTVSHCHAGMVFAMNADPETFAAFQSAAEAGDIPAGASVPATQSPTATLPQSSLVSPPNSSSLSTGATGSGTPSVSDVPPARKQVPVAAIAGSVSAFVVLLFLFLAAFLVRRRRRASGLRHLGLEQGVNTRPDPLILYEKTNLPGGVSSFTDGGSSASSVLPTAAERALVAVEEEMRVLRNKVHRLELDRHRESRALSSEDEPPDYATGYDT
ncbi:hypothetical protein DFH09DRAFT_625724 [Mycena vulgaris]|nr:hypothetical protein DFH09DRAFT_271175 [Mycena vulgaris]KAJ6599681.1 hypothetical protein DFH09DRAFT_625724 [Mycena vulgaris]